MSIGIKETKTEEIKNKKHLKLMKAYQNNLNKKI